MSIPSSEEFRSRLRPFGIVFEKSLRDLITGIRAHKEPDAQAKFLEKAIAECRKEVKSSDMDLKTMSILKLCYLEMYGFDMSWANFHVLEVMASSKFQQKRVGYLAASQALRKDEDVLMLATNQLKKDLNSSSSVEVGVALSGVSTIVTPTLARDVADDIVKMLNHSKPYIRKKAVLALYKIFLQYPQALRSSFDRLCDKLDDEDDSVMAATVTVICEVAKKVPKNFIHLAPRLFDIFTSTKNNWVIIRLLKLFSSLAQIEPRLNQRLIPQIIDTIRTTNALSLVYECVNCIVVGEMLDDSNLDVAKMCVDYLKPFFEHQDPNLKFVGLLTLNKIALVQPDIIQSQSAIILECISHPDISIRTQALELLKYVISEDNLEQAVLILMHMLAPYDHDDSSSETSSFSNLKIESNLSDEFKETIISRILDSCTANNYEYVSDFDWLISVFSRLVKIAASLCLNEAGARLGLELRNVLVKIPSIRSAVLNDYLVQLLDNSLVITNLITCVSELVWSTGEFASFLNDPKNVLFKLMTIFESSNIITESGYMDSSKHLDQAVCVLVPALVKIFNAGVNSDPNYIWSYHEKLNTLNQLEKLISFLTSLSFSKNFNIQERAIEFLEFLKLVKQSITETPDDSLQAPLLLVAVLPSLFNGWELKPISKDAQKMIPVPDTLDLDTEIYPMDAMYSGEDQYLNYRNRDYHSDQGDSDFSESEDEFKEYSNPLLQDDGLYHDDLEPSEEDKKSQRLAKQKDDPFYLTDRMSKSPEPGSDSTASIMIKSPAIKEKKPKKKKMVKPVVLTEEIIPGTEKLSIAEDKKKKKKKNILKIDSSGLENFDALEQGLEQLQGYEVDETVVVPTELVVVSKKKKKSKSKKSKKKRIELE